VGGASGFTVSIESGFTGSKLLVLDVALLVAVNLAALGASW